MKGLAEYAGIGIVALALWLLPRPLGWMPKQTGVALAAAASLSAWVIIRSQAAIVESKQQELLDFKAQQDTIEIQAQQSHLAAIAQRQQAQLAAERQQFQQELNRAVVEKDAELTELAQSKLATLEQLYQQLEQARAEFEQQRQEFERQQQIAAAQPSLVEQAKAKVAEQRQMLEIGLDLAKGQVHVEHELEQYRQSLGASKPQDAQSAALLQLMEGMERLNARVNQQQSGLAAYPTVDTSAVPAGARQQRRAAPTANFAQTGFTEPEYNRAWSDAEPPASSYSDEVVID